METEKEIELNKSKIKSLQKYIDEEASELQSLGHYLEIVRYEYNLLIEESRNLINSITPSKKDFLNKNRDLINYPEDSSIKLLRRYIVNLSSHFKEEYKSETEYLKKTRELFRKIPLFELEYFPTKVCAQISSNRKINVPELIASCELFDYCEFNKKLIIEDQNSSTHQTKCLINTEEAEIIIAEYANLKSYELMLKAKDKKEQVKYLEELAKMFRKQIDDISQINFKKNNYKDINVIGHIIFYVPIENALKEVLKHDPEIMQYALDKDIEIFFPTTLLGALTFISYCFSPKGIADRFNKYEKIKEQLIGRKIKEIKEKKSTISKLLKINFEYLKSPSYQVKVTLNHEENYVLEEIVNTKGSNKSSVLRQILMEYKDIYKERDALKLSVEKLNLEMKFNLEKQEQIKKQIINDKDAQIADILAKAKGDLKDKTYDQELIKNKLNAEIESIKNELINRTNQYHAENIHLKEQLIRNEEILSKEFNSIKEVIREKNIEVSTEEKSKNSIRIIIPKNLNEFEKIMDLINQNILIICDLKNLSNEEKQRFIDRIYGAIYGLKGNIKEISDNISLYIPQSFSFIDN